MKYQHIDENGQVQVHPIDIAMARHMLVALCGPQAATPSTLRAPAVPLFPTETLRPAP
ncbi:hypothetical protein ACWEN6_08060 [Sphaerisporangium sp. NPDC004334]